MFAIHKIEDVNLRNRKILFTLPLHLKFINLKSKSKFFEHILSIIIPLKSGTDVRVVDI